MDAQSQTSFIPHDAGSIDGRARFGSSGGLSDLFLLLAIVALIGSGALAGGVFFYDQYLSTQVTSKIGQLKKAENEFDPSLVSKLTQLDDRMLAAGDVLSNHVAPTAFLAALDQTTLTTVAFSDLQFDSTDKKTITIKMSGVAQSVNSIALQADIYSKSGVIMNPIFTGIDRQPDGVHFNLAAEVNPAAIKYESVISTGGANAAAQIPNTSATSQDQSAATTPVQTPVVPAVVAPVTPAATETASTTPPQKGAVVNGVKMVRPTPTR